MSKGTSEILKNKDAIAVDQDTLGISGFVYSQQGPIEIWAKPLAYGEWAVCFLNSGREVKDVNFSWNENKIVDTLTNRELNPGKDKYTISDLWKHKDIGSTNKDFSAAIPSHDVVLLRLKPAK
jgi:alpha-galactosidase